MLYYTVRPFLVALNTVDTPLNVKCDFPTKWSNLSRDMKTDLDRNLKVITDIDGLIYAVYNL